MRSCLLAFFLVFVCFLTRGQQATGILEVNNIRCLVTSSGDLFIHPEQSMNLFEAPIDGGVSTLYAGNLWMGGISSDQQLHLAAERFQADGRDWYTGPLTVDGAASIDDAVEAQYDQVWMANSADVATHIAWFVAVQNGTQDEEFPDGYTIPEWIMEWPAHGDWNNGQSLFLAPFMDWDGDQVYDPTAGDYPLFCGDQCAFFIINDKGDVHSESNGQPIGLEIHGMLYAFDVPTDPMLHNTVFLKYTIHHRGNLVLADSYVALWLDPDLGNPTDDYLATNVERSGVYVYNGDDLDEPSSGSAGFGLDIPMQGIVLLAGPLADTDGIDNPLPDGEYSGLTDSYGDYGWGFGDGLVDNERLGLSYSNFLSANPTTAVHYYYGLSGYANNGSAITYGGSGMDPSNAPTRYMYPGNDDPLNLSTGDPEQEVWTEASAGNAAGDRRALLSSGPFTLQPQSVHELDFAFVFAQGADLDTLLEQRMADAKLFFNESLLSCADGDQPVHVDELAHASFGLFPNPASEQCTVQLPDHWGPAGFEVVDLSGRIVLRGTVREQSMQLPVSEWSPGVYFVRLTSDVGSASRALVVR